jgi:hypothetical protein
MMIPAAISRTTEGIRREGTSHKPSGTKKAIAAIISTAMREISDTMRISSLSRL